MRTIRLTEAEWGKLLREREVELGNVLTARAKQLPPHAEPDEIWDRRLWIDHEIVWKLKHAERE